MNNSYGKKWREYKWWELRDLWKQRKFPGARPYKKRWDYDTESGWRYGTDYGKSIHRHAYGGRNNVIDAIRNRKRNERWRRRYKHSGFFKAW